MFGRLASGFGAKPRRSLGGPAGGGEKKPSLKEALRNRGGAQHVVSAPTDFEDNEPVREKSSLEWLNLTAFPIQSLQAAIDRMRPGLGDTDTDGGESDWTPHSARVTVSAGGKMANSRRHSMPNPPPVTKKPPSLRKALAARGGYTRRPSSDNIASLSSPAAIVADSGAEVVTASGSASPTGGSAADVSTATDAFSTPISCSAVEAADESDLCLADPLPLSSVAEEREAEAEAEGRTDHSATNSATTDDAKAGGPAVGKVQEATESVPGISPAEAVAVARIVEEKSLEATATARATDALDLQRPRTSSGSSDHGWIGKPKAFLQNPERPKVVTRKPSWAREDEGEIKVIAPTVETRTDKIKHFNDLTKFWGRKNSMGFAGPSLEKGKRMSRNEAQATLQRLIAAGSKVDFDEVRRLRKLVSDCP